MRIATVPRPLLPGLTRELQPEGRWARAGVAVFSQKTIDSGSIRNDEAAYAELEMWDRTGGLTG
jgi:hypothetical protein